MPRRCGPLAAIHRVRFLLYISRSLHSAGFEFCGLRLVRGYESEVNWEGWAMIVRLEGQIVSEQSASAV